MVSFIQVLDYFYVFPVRIYSKDVIMLLQPREIKDIKDFLLKARRKDAKCKYMMRYQHPSVAEFPLFNIQVMYFVVYPF